MKNAFIFAGLWAASSLAAYGAVDAPIPATWQTRLPAIQSLVRHTFSKEVANAHYPVSLMETANLSGSPGAEALINLGSGGYTDDVTVMQLHDDNPILARFRNGDHIGPKVFSVGLADDHGGEVRLVEKDHAIFSGYWERKGSKLKECRGEVYQWDATTRTFDYAGKLSKQLGKDYCSAVISKLKL
jgi:hypothetical protein